MPLHKLAVWRFCDGNTGHEKQTQALLEGLRREANVDAYDIPVTGTLSARLLQRLLRRQPLTERLPDPDLLIGAGHRTHWPLLTARRARGGKAVVLMKPSLPLSWFDLAIIPDHDRPAPRPNLLCTRTVLAPPLHCRPDPRSGLILIGGESRHFHWRSPAIGDQIDRLVRASPHIQWQLTTSRRTPADFEAPRAPNLRAYDHRRLEPGWLSRELCHANQVCLTMDSGSMLAEALNSAARVTLLPLPSRRRRNKLLWGAERLRDQGLVHFYSPDEPDPSRGGFSNPAEPVRILNEQSRCARILLRELFATLDHPAISPQTLSA